MADVVASQRSLVLRNVTDVLDFGIGAAFLVIRRSCEVVVGGDIGIILSRVQDSMRFGAFGFCYSRDLCVLG